MQIDLSKTTRFFGCSVEQAKAQFGRNAVGLSRMAAKANSLGRKLNGYSSAELRKSAEQYRRASL